MRVDCQVRAKHMGSRLFLISWRCATAMPLFLFILLTTTERMAYIHGSLNCRWYIGNTSVS